MRIKKFNLVGGLLVLAASVVHAPGQEARRAGSGRHPLWKVEGPVTTLYLLGSVHLLKKENYPLAAPIEAAFSNAQIAVFEADMEKMHDRDAQEKMMSLAQLPAGEALPQHLSPETYAAFTNCVGKAGLPPAAFDGYKPMIAVSVLEIGELQKLGFEPQYGVDEHFLGRARREGKEILALETVDFQIDLVTGLAKEESDSVMKAELKELENTKKEFAEIIAAWQSGNSEKLAKLLHEAMQESPALFKRLVTDRNHRWLPKLQELARGNKKAIVIVGAGHLVGKEGVVELLRKEGLKVTQQ